jgi:hypothetical protein
MRHGWFRKSIGGTCMPFPLKKKPNPMMDPSMSAAIPPQFPSAMPTPVKVKKKIDPTKTIKKKK